jgi:mono/diheme cytochrome c family protein
MRSSRGIVIGLLGIVVVAAGGVLAWLWLWPAIPKIDPDNAAQVSRGHVVYTAQCARCHGANLEGQPNWRERQANGRLPAPPHDATGHTWHHPDRDLFGITKHGIAEYAPPGYQSDMPAFENVSTDEDIAAVLAYIKSQWPPDVRVRQERINAQAEQ